MTMKSENENEEKTNEESLVFQGLCSSYLSNRPITIKAFI